MKISVVPTLSLGLFAVALYVISTNCIATGFQLQPQSIVLPSHHAAGVRNTRRGTRLAQTNLRFLDSFPFLNKKSATRQEIAKANLLEICESSDDLSTKRQRVEALLDDMKSASPITETSTSPLLVKDWQVIWTTEKEINLFLDRGWATDIYQGINDGRIENTIPFVNDRGSLNVKGTITPQAGYRTEFEFTEARLTLANPFNAKQKFEINLPPVGKGWFDTLYLDDTLRVDINSRDDILVCRPV